MSADILEYVDQKVRDSASSSTEWSILYADDWAKLRAEIVRLRGEVCSCPSGDGSLRWPCKAHPPESIAPAEAKGDLSSRMYRGPSHPDTERANLLDRRSIAEESPQPADGGAVAWLPSAHEWLSENQGDASQDWIDGWNACRSRWQSITTQAPAVPTGAVWIMPVATDPPQNRNLMRMAWGASALSTGELANAYDSIVSAAQRCGQVITHPPAAQVQQEAVADCVTIAATRCYGDEWFREIRVKGVTFLAPLDQQDAAAFILSEKRRNEATHPAGDALGAEDTELLRWLIANELIVHQLKDNGRWMIVAGDLSPAIDGSEHDTPREAIRAALQHRGDSRGGEG